MQVQWRIELLGGLHARQGRASDASVRIISRFRRQKTGALLAYLAFYRDQTHPREVLCELLWPEFAPTQDATTSAKPSLRCATS